MRFLNEDIIKYGLHDTQVTDVCEEAEGLSLMFDGGVYRLVDGKESDLTSKCVLKISILNYNPNDRAVSVEIYKIKRGKLAEIRYEDFVNLLENDVFDISEDMWSNVTRSLLVIGYVAKQKIIFKISDITDIKFLL